MSGLVKNNDGLPEGWEWKKVSDLGKVLTGTTPTKAKKEYYDSKGYPFFKPTDLNEGYYEKNMRMVYIVIDIGKMGKKNQRIWKLRNDMLGKGLPASEIFIIDGEIKPSASKL